MSDNVMATLAVMRAGDALSMAREYLSDGSPSQRAKAFVEAARLIALERHPENIVPALQRSTNEALTKAVAAHVTLDTVWQDADAQALARSFIASVGEPDVLTAIARYASVLTKASSRVLIATGFAGDTLAEGFPKAVRRLDLNLGPDTNYTKSLALVVCSNELLSKTDDAGLKLFETELAKAVVRAANAAVIAALVDSSTTSAAAGADPLASLRAGLMAAGPSSGYVVAAPAGWVAWLSTHEANRGGMGVRGGTFSPGVEIIAIDDATTMHVIPAERLSYWDGGLELRATTAATVDMADTPATPGEKVSLWQTNSSGLLVERFWRIEGDTSGVVVVG
jgi:hypothetical protein